MKSRLYIALIALVLLAGCGTRNAPVSDAPAAVAVDLNALPTTVDAATVAALVDNPNVLVLDVREPEEYAAGHIPGVTLMPVSTVADRLNEIPTDRPVIVTCRTGNRSGQVTDYLRQQGYTNIHNMQGGILAWEAAGLPVEK